MVYPIIVQGINWVGNEARFGVFSFVLTVLVLLQLPALAATSSVTLAWSPSTDATIAGYRVYYGVASHNYTNRIAAGRATSITIPGLVVGKTYYFAATTYSTAGVESAFSSELAYLIPSSLNVPPTLNAINSLTINENAGPQTVSLSNITSGSTTENQTLTVTATSSNTGLIPNPTVIYTSPKSTGSLSLRPALNRTGTAAITVTVKDGGQNNNLVTRMFNVTVVGTSITTSSRRPTLGSHLTNEVALIGQNKIFAVSATGMGALKYQWNHNGSLLPTAVGPILTLKNVTTNQSGVYSVTVTDRNGSTNSIASLTVYATTAAQLAPASSTGGQYALTLTGVPGFKYVVQASTNLTTWVPVRTNYSPFAFVDTTAGKFHQRFYRSVYAP